MYTKKIVGLVFLFLFHIASLFAANSNAQRIKLDDVLAIGNVHLACKSFYPIKKNNQIKWDQLLLTVINEYTLRSPNDIVGFLDSIYADFGLRVSNTERNQEDLYKGKWIHKGCGQCSNAFIKNRFTKMLYSTLGPYKSTFHRKEQSNTHYFISPNSKDTTYIQFTAANINNSRIKQSPYNSCEIGISSLTEVWGFVKLFYPYKFNRLSFDSLYVDFLNELISSDSCTEEDIQLKLKSLLSLIDDGHVTVFTKGNKFSHTIPIKVDLIEDSLVISNVSTALSQKQLVEVGNRISFINDMDYKTVLNEKKRLVSASNNRFKAKAACLDLFDGTKNSLVKLTVLSNDNSLKEIILSRDSVFYMYSKKHEARFLENDILYYDISQAQRNKKIKKELKQGEYKGVVFDMREYPNSDLYFLGSLSCSEKLMSSPKMLVPKITSLQNNIEEFDTSRWFIKCRQVIQENTPVVFITNTNAISTSETYLSIVKYYNLATIIGDTTAGTNGNVINIRPHGLYSVYLTGMKVLN